MDTSSTNTALMGAVPATNATGQSGQDQTQAQMDSVKAQLTAEMNSVAGREHPDWDRSIQEQMTSSGVPLATLIKELNTMVAVDNSLDKGDALLRPDPVCHATSQAYHEAQDLKAVLAADTPSLPGFSS